MGLTFPCGKTAQDHAVFESRFYGSLHAVYRLKKLHNLNKHRGCVNSINFHPEGKNNDLKWIVKIMLVFSVADVLCISLGIILDSVTTETFEN